MHHGVQVELLKHDGNVGARARDAPELAEIHGGLGCAQIAHERERRVDVRNVIRSLATTAAACERARARAMGN